MHVFFNFSAIHPGTNPSSVILNAVFSTCFPVSFCWPMTLEVSPRYLGFFFTEIFFETPCHESIFRGNKTESLILLNHHIPDFLVNEPSTISKKLPIWLIMFEFDHSSNLQNTFIKPSKYTGNKGISNLKKPFPATFWGFQSWWHDLLTGPNFEMTATGLKICCFRNKAVFKWRWFMIRSCSSLETLGNKAAFHPHETETFRRWIFCFPRLCGSVVDWFGIRRLLFKQLGPANVHPSLPPFLQADHRS